MFIKLKSIEILGLLDLAIAQADKLDNTQKKELVSRFSFRDMRIIKEEKDVYHPWYVWEASLPKFLRSTREGVIQSKRDDFYIEVLPYTNLLKLIAQKEFDPFMVGKI